MTFLDFCRLHGVIIDALPREGIWKRYKTEDKPHHRNGAVKFLGDHGHCQNHATMQEVATWHADGATTAARPIDQARAQAQRDRDRAYRVQAMRSARQFWRESRPLLNRPHPYVERKGLSPLGCAGLRTYDGLLVVPVMLGDWLISVQTITAEGEKRFWPGAPVKAGTHMLLRQRAALTVFCEGLATGLAIYQAVRQASVVVAFDCGNLLPAIEQTKPTGSVVIAADNDHRTALRIGTNPGIEKARNAAELIGCGIAYPQGIEGTDWADYLKETGEAGPRKMERLILAGARFVLVT